MSAAAWLWIVAIATLLGSLLSALFHSLKDMTRSALEERARVRGETSALRQAERILEDVGTHSTAVALPRIVCNMVVAIASVAYVQKLAPETLPTWATMLIGIAGSSLLVWVFGLLIPHAVASYAAEGTVLAWAWLIRLCYWMQRPFEVVTRFFDEVVRRLSGRPPTSEAEQLQAELMSVVEEAQESGQFDQTERNMIESLVGFRGTTVEQIMTPRTEIEALQLTNNLGEVIRFIRACRHSRIPVFEGSLDHVVGMFYIKDLMRWLAGDGARASGKPFELRSILRPALFVPETKTIRELLAELIDKKVHVAMVADEYGGTSGMVTLEDIVEEVFGEIQDEYELPEDDVPQIVVSEQDAELDARAYIGDANAALAPLGLRLPQGEDYDTVGGLVVTTLGRIPAIGETMSIERSEDGTSPGIEIAVLESEPTRVIRVRMRRRDDGADPLPHGSASTPETLAETQEVVVPAKPEAVEKA
jgi:CBS domain containing-hemolysin-like protein